jgi:predicted phosphodiesterase
MLPKRFTPKELTTVLLILVGVLTLAWGCGQVMTAPDTPSAAPEEPAAQITTPPTIPPTAEIPVETAVAIETQSPEETATQADPGPDYFSSGYPPSQIAYVIPLTLRHAGPDRAVLFFEIGQPAGGRLVYRSRLPGQPDQRVIPLDPSITRHRITVEGLSPDAAYQAVVLLGSNDSGFEQPLFAGEIWGPVDFRTSGRTPFRVGVLGDASFGDEATIQLVELMAGQDLDFVIHTGDVVYETEGADLFSSYLTKYFQPFAPLLHLGPVYTVLGNHDYDASVRWQEAPFYDYAFPPFEDPAFQYPPERRANQFYAFAVGDVQFLMLDSQAIFGAGGREVQDAWLAERLADPRFRVTIPIFHVSLYSSSVVHPEDSLPVRYSWQPLFEAANVPLVLSGHFHHYERLLANGITYIVTGGGSSTLYAQGAPLPESVLYVRRTHFVLLEFFEDRIQLSAVSKDGDAFDQAIIPLN